MYYTSKEVYKFISKQTNDPIVERKICAVSGAEFPIYKSDMEFYDKISPIFNGVKYQIPTPTLCPEERQRRRLLFRNERKLYKRKCDASGKDIISIYSPDKSYKVYDQKFWWSDGRDSINFEKKFDFDKNFSEQFFELKSQIPRNSSINDDWISSTNCQYTVDFAFWKNCYMCFETWENENCYYCHHCNTSDNLVDCDLVIWRSSNCYQCQNSENLFNCHYCVNCKSSKDCFWCIWLINKQYCIFNKQYTKEEYKSYISNLSTKYVDESFKKLRSNVIFYNNIVSSEKVFWENIFNSKNIFWNNIFNSKDCRYCINSDRIINSYDLQCWNSELCYEWQTPDYWYKNIFSWFSWNCKNSYYLDSCHYCEFCFACIWLRNKQYCIFNKQYTKEAYEELVPKIIEHMQKTWERGEFFNPSLSPFGYNETVAQEYFPLSREEALARWYKRQDNNYDPIIPEWANVVKSDQVESLKSDEEILKSIFICEVSERPFRIIKQELDFYRKHNLPLPRKHPDVRHEERMKLRPKRELHLRNCDKCGIEIVSVYPKEFEWKVYCESCYQKDVY